MCSSAHCFVVIANTSLMKSFGRAPVICCDGCPRSSVLKTLPTVWCVRSHIALTCGFLLVVGTFLIQQPSNNSWDSGSINLPPLLGIRRAGHGYRVSQTCAYFLAMWADVLSSIRTSSTKFETVSIIVRAMFAAWVACDLMEPTNCRLQHRSRHSYFPVSQRVSWPNIA